MTRSLLDTADGFPIDVWVAFRDVYHEGPPGFWWQFLEPGFQHVECWRLDRGAWVRLEPCFEFAILEAHTDPPWLVLNPDLNPRFVRVRRVVPRWSLRKAFKFGPITCVDAAKLFLGLRLPTVWTPFQLYKYLRKQQGP